MIVSCCPYRVSLAGGGSDLPNFYMRHGGAVVSLALDAHVQVSIDRSDVRGLRRSGANGGNATSAHSWAIDDPLVHGVFKFANATPPMSLTVHHDLPTGAGLGSSAAQCVAMLAALSIDQSALLDPGLLARQACQVEIEILGRPVGKQDPYGVAFGGVKLIEFTKDDSVMIRPLNLDKATLCDLQAHAMLFDSGYRRSAAAILNNILAVDQNRRDRLLESMKSQAYLMAELLESNAGMMQVGKLLHEGWIAKRQLSSAISLPLIDKWYQSALDSGAYGGKLLGAGGGGYLLLLADPDRHNHIRGALGHPREFPLRIASAGVYRQTCP
jgi:D-glycero-alpha-D-manno-heptose-7-phosphate kinase